MRHLGLTVVLDGLPVRTTQIQHIDIPPYNRCTTIFGIEGPSGNCSFKNATASAHVGHLVMATFKTYADRDLTAKQVRNIKWRFNIIIQTNWADRNPCTWQWRRGASPGGIILRNSWRLASIQCLQRTRACLFQMSRTNCCIVNCANNYSRPLLSRTRNWWYITSFR